MSLPSIPEQFAQIAQRRCAASAIISPDITLSYADVLERTGAIVSRLSAQGIGRGCFVAISVTSQSRRILAAVAVNYAGAAFVFLHPAGTAATTNERIMATLKPSALLVDHDSLVGVLTTQPNVVVVDLRQLESERRRIPPAAIDEDDCAYAVFTSGSSGRPKGVAISHRTLNQYLDWQHRTFSLSPSRRLALWAPFTFDACYGEFYGALLAGAELHAPAFERRCNPRYMAEWLGDHSVDWYVTVPSFLAVLVEHLQQSPALRERLSSLREVAVSGEALSCKLARRLYELLPAVTLHNLYGPTETILACHYVVPRALDSEEEMSIGRPFDGREILLLGEDLEPVVEGTVGQISILTAYMAQGYLDAPEESSQRFVSGARVGRDSALQLYLTGDFGFRARDGRLFFRGRRDNQVKIQGCRVQLEEVEGVLRTHPDVEECALSLVSVNQENWALVAVLVERLASADADLETHLRARLPDYAVPRLFVRTSDLPRGVNGKFDRTRIARLVAEHFRQ
jgi:amino acid adenylation domain-containing protein